MNSAAASRSPARGQTARGPSRRKAGPAATGPAIPGADARRRAAGDAEEHRETLARHARYYAGLLERLETELKGFDQLDALAMMDREIDNLRAAWRWMSTQKDMAGLSRAMSSFALYYQIRSRFAEGREAFERAAEAVHGSPLYGYLLQAHTWFIASSIGWGPIVWKKYKEALSVMNDPETSGRQNGARQQCGETGADQARFQGTKSGWARPTHSVTQAL